MFNLTDATFLEAERKTGSFIPDGETTARSWDYTECRFLVGKSSVVKVRLPKGVHVSPFTEGEVYDIAVTVPDRATITLATSELAALSSAA